MVVEEVLHGSGKEEGVVRVVAGWWCGMVDAGSVYQRVAGSAYQSLVHLSSFHMFHVCREACCSHVVVASCGICTLVQGKEQTECNQVDRRFLS